MYYYTPAHTKMITNKNIYLFLLSLFLLSINVLATRINYVARYREDSNQEVERVQLQSNIPDGQEDKVTRHASEWSRGKFRAYYNKREVLTVEAVEEQRNKRRANQIVQEMQRLIDLRTQPQSK